MMIKIKPQNRAYPATKTRPRSTGLLGPIPPKINEAFSKASSHPSPQNILYPTTPTARVAKNTSNKVSGETINIVVILYKTTLQKFFLSKNHHRIRSCASSSGDSRPRAKRKKWNPQHCWSGVRRFRGSRH
jgi:hypothetical protein